MIVHNPAEAEGSAVREVYAAATGKNGSAPEPMRALDYLSRTIYQFASLDKPAGGKPIPVKQALELIQHSNYWTLIRQARLCGKGSSEYDHTKKFQVPCFVWNVSQFEKNYRDKAKAKEFSGLMYLDIDTPGATPDILAELPELVFAWQSFGGKGVGFLVAVEGLTNENYLSTWQSLKARYLQQGIEIDESAKDPARANVLSFSEVFVNKGEVLPFKAVEPLVLPKPKRQPISGETAPAANAYTALKKWLENKDVYFVSGNRNNYIFQLAGGCNRAGLEQHIAEAWIIEEFEQTGFTSDEIRTAVASGYKDTAAFGSRPFVIESETFGKGPNLTDNNLQRGAAQKVAVCAPAPAFEPNSYLTFRMGPYKKRIRECEITPKVETHLLRAGQYVADLHLDHGHTCYMDSGTGTGKSTAELQSGHPIDFYVPTQELARQLAKKEGHDYVMEGRKATDSDVLIATYNALDKLQHSRDTSSRVMVIDEAHNLPMGQGYRGEIMNALLDASREYKALRLLSGTPLPATCHPLLQRIPVVQVRRENEPVKRWRLIKYNERYPALLSRLERGKLQTIVLQNKKKGKRLAKLLSSKGYSVQCFNSDTKGEENHRLILDTCHVTDGVDVLIVTGLFFEGLTIDNTNIGAVHLLSQVSRYDIQQLFNRYRNQLPEMLNVYRSHEAEETDLGFDFKQRLAVHLEQAQAYVDQLNKSEDDPESYMAQLARSLVKAMAKQPAKIARKVGESWEVNYLAVDYLTALEETRAMYRNPELMKELLGHYCFSFEGVEIDHQKDIALKAEAADISQAIRKDELQEQKDIIANFQYGGSSYVMQALDSKSDEERKQATRVVQLQEHVGFEQALELLNRPLSDDKYEELLNQVRAQAYLHTRRTDHLHTSYTRVIDAIYRTFNVGDMVTPEEILKRFKTIRNKHFETQRRTLTENKAVRHLKRYFDVTRTKRTCKDNPKKQENCYLVLSTNPLNLTFEERRTAA